MADGVSLTYRYDPLGRLQEQLSSDQTIHYVYTYDLNDNLLQAKISSIKRQQPARTTS